MEVIPLSNSHNVTVQRNDVDVDVDVEEFFLFNFTKKNKWLLLPYKCVFWDKKHEIGPIYKLLIAFL